MASCGVLVAFSMKKVAQSVLLNLLGGYRWLISPLLAPACRYVPTCSEYAVEAIDRFGVVKGTGMAIWRLLRCHPFVEGGYDPVVKSQVCEVELGQRRVRSH